MCSYIWPGEILGFDWDEDNISHVARHRVDPDEIEEIFDDAFIRLRGKRGRANIYGRSAAGRYLWACIEMKDGLVRFISAREMDADEKRWFRENI